MSDSSIIGREPSASAKIDIFYPTLNVPADYHSGSTWLFRALPDDSNRNSFQGLVYDDELTYKYSYTSKVQNSSSVKVGDFVLVRDNKVLLGSALIQSITQGIRTIKHHMCPTCGAGGSQITWRRSSQDWRCDGKCRKVGESMVVRTFSSPVVKEQTEQTFTAEYGDTWADLTGAMAAPDFESLSSKWNRQNSIVRLDPTKVQDFLGSLNVAFRNQLQVSSEGGFKELAPGGFVDRVVRTRIGQESFRASLVKTYGSVCAFSGPCHLAALDAAHLYWYAKVGKHYQDAGLLLRKDLHRLFDVGLLTVDDKLRVQLHSHLRGTQYELMHGGLLKVQVSKVVVDFLGQHHQRFAVEGSESRDNIFLGAPR